MIKASVILLSLCFLSECGSSRHVDPELVEFYNDFISDCRRYNAYCRTDNLNIRYVKKEELPDNILGLCDRNLSKNGIKNEIFIAEELDRAKLKNTFYHEAYHCMVGFFGLSHYTEDVDIMNENSEYDQLVIANWDYYVAKAFARAPKNN